MEMLWALHLELLMVLRLDQYLERHLERHLERQLVHQ